MGVRSKIKSLFFQIFFVETCRTVTVSSVCKRIQDSLCFQPIRAIGRLVQSVIAENGSNCEAHILRMLANVLSKNLWFVCFKGGLVDFF